MVGRSSAGGSSWELPRRLSLMRGDCIRWIENAVNPTASKTRLILWIDAVGGYFICLTPEVRLGQAVPESDVEVPLLADLSRHHATLRRDEEGYTIDPVRETRLNGQVITTPSWLNDGSRLELGATLKLRFSRPHALSATARLDYVSHHRTQPSSAAVLLMADTLILGPSAENHVVCRHWPHDVVLHRQHGGLFVSSRTPVIVGGQEYESRAPLGWNSRVEGEGFSFSLEEI